MQRKTDYVICITADSGQVLLFEFDYKYKTWELSNTYGDWLTCMVPDQHAWWLTNKHGKSSTHMVTRDVGNLHSPGKILNVWFISHRQGDLISDWIYWLTWNWMIKCIFRQIIAWCWSMGEDWGSPPPPLWSAMSLYSIVWSYFISLGIYFRYICGN